MCVCVRGIVLSDSLHNGPIDLPRHLRKRAFLCTSFHVPNDNILGVVRVLHHLAEGDKVALAWGKVNVLDPLVLKFADTGELGGPPECHAHLMDSGQVGPRGGPVKISFCPTLQVKNRPCFNTTVTCMSHVCHMSKITSLSVTTLSS